MLRRRRRRRRRRVASSDLIRPMARWLGSARVRSGVRSRPPPSLLSASSASLRSGPRVNHVDSMFCRSARCSRQLDDAFSPTTCGRVSGLVIGVLVPEMPAFKFATCLRLGMGCADVSRWLLQREPSRLISTPRGMPIIKVATLGMVRGRQLPSVLRVIVLSLFR